jgi:hypothetical protein
MHSKTFNCILVALFTLGLVASRQTFAEDDYAPVIASYKSFLPKFIAAFSKEGIAGMYDGPARNVRYDLKKTDSVIYPLQGILVFFSSRTPDDLHGGDYKKFSFTFSYSDGKWTVTSGSRLAHFKDGDPLDANDITDFAEAVAEKAQKD